MRKTLTALLAGAATLTAAPLAGEVVTDRCAGSCSVIVSPGQLLKEAELAVAERRFDVARPLVEALAAVPEYNMQRHFLAGYIAVETGQLDLAATHFRAALSANPKATRIRLELARTMMLQGKDGSAEYNFRLAEEDDSLPPEILATIRQSRGLLRDRKTWHVNANIGIAPDTNITNGTKADTVDLIFGNQNEPLKTPLEGNARARSGIGQTASLSAGYRFRVADKIALLADVDAQGVNYKGKSVDDYIVQAAVGPELRFGESTTLSMQGIASQRWYGGVRASTQFGGRATLQHDLSSADRVGLTLDARHADSGFSRDYDGWTLGAYASYERVVAQSMVASASLFARSERLRSDGYSGNEFGLNLGFGGELPHGINAGISGGLSRMTYDAPLPLLSLDPRADWRYNARAYAGLRSIRVLGFSPSVTFSYSKIESSVALYKAERSRLAFNLARYF